MNQSTSSDISFFKSFYVRYICVLLKTFHHFYRIVSYQAVCTPTIHGIHRIIRKAQNELFLKFHRVLEITHVENSSLFSPITKYWKDKSLHDFIVKTEFILTEHI